MAEYATFDDLAGGDDDGPVDLTLPSGRIVQVRGLSRYEWFLAGKETSGEPNGFEAYMISIGMTAPKLSRKQVDTWRRRPGTVRDLAVLSDRIRELTGIDEGADKSDVREVRESS